jgi:hypothetical protein
MHWYDYYVQKQTSTIAKFESPFVHLKKSQPGALVPPSTPTNQLATRTDGSPHKLGQKTGDGLPIQKKVSRKKKKFCPVDDEISLHRHDMKAGISNVKVLTRTVDLRAATVNHIFYMDRANKYLVLKFYPDSYQNHLNLRNYSFKCTPNQVGMIMTT